MSKRRFLNGIRHWVLVAGGAVLLTTSYGGPIDVSQTPLVVSNTESVYPNIFFVLDDSGSMNWDFMPDHVAYNANGTSTDIEHCRNSGAGLAGQPLTGNFNRRCCENNGVTSGSCWVGAAPFGSKRAHPPFMASQFNGVAYNPAIRYRPPATAAGGEWASMTTWTSVPNDAYNVQFTDSIDLLTSFPDTEWCTDGTFSDCLRNGNYVLPGRVNSKDYTTFRAVTATGTGSIAVGAPDAAITQTRDFGPHYYNIVGSEYCTDISLRHCQQGLGGAFTVPASVRWCDTDANSRAANPARNACQAVRTSAFPHVRYPTKYAAAGTSGSAASVQIDFAVSGCTGSRTVGVQSLTVGSTDLLGGVATGSTQSADTLATLVRDGIRNKSATTGFTASKSGTRVTITAPTSAGNLTSVATLVRTSASNCSFTPTTSAAFGGYAAPTTAFGGSFERVDIVPSRTTYPKALTRSDCAAAGHCTYSEEMTNFANWWAYYRTRMQAMKTASTRAFVGVGANRRLGFTTLNTNGNQMFLNLATFTGTHKTNWFNKLQAASPNSGTPLRPALSQAGRLYAGRLKGNSIDGVTVEDPMQYSCQRNYTILSTDGFWNSGAGYKIDGSTAMDDQDGGLTGAMQDRSSTAGTLADIAAYYRLTDLRTTSPWCSGALGVDVCGSAGSVQNMVTFTLGLGAPGVMQYVDGYDNVPSTSPDFNAVANGLTPDASIGQCSWQTTGRCTWPIPADNRPANIDDLWHAAVNGGGKYFSAKDPDSLYTGIRKTLEDIDGVERATAAATTSNPNITAGDNQIFVSSFKTQEWSGELEGKRINTVTGNVIAGQDWSASARLDANTSRRVLMFDSSATDRLKSFSWTEMSATEKSYFQLPWITAVGRSLSQFCVVGPYCLSAASQAGAAGEALVRFLAGERGQEGPEANLDKPFRERASRLGDVVNSEAVYVGAPSMEFLDSGYAAFAGTNASRRKMVYIGANDGMLHALDAETGDEVWAYVPTAVIPRLYKLADKQYASKHEYYVDGTANVQDVYIGGTWKTVLIGSLGAGGRSYFALDVTDPDDPEAMWEFTHANLGLTMGKAEIGKLSNGDWVAILPSGLNNIPDSNLPYTATADGGGYLFVLDLASGALKTSVNGTGIIATGQGSTSTPSGLGHVRAWYDDGEKDATILRVYGGDNLGNVWRFDINNNVAPAGFEALRLITLKNASGEVQPVTARPELGQVGSYAMVFVGTGRYLGTSDLSDTKQQSIYGIKDRLTNQSFDEPRSAISAFVRQTFGTGTCPAGVSACTTGSSVRVVTNPQPVNLATNGGWYVDLPVSSERVNTEPVLALGTLVVTSNIFVAGNICEEGRAWVNFLDYRTGASVRTAQGVAGVALNGLGSRSTVGMLPSGAVRRYTTVSNSPRLPDAGALPVDVSAGGTRRHSWRDLGGN